MRLARRSEPFDHPDWIYEIKFDGFRALAYVESGKMSPRFPPPSRIQVLS
jgi:ATP-dependent DNA ligase